MACDVRERAVTAFVGENGGTFCGILSEILPGPKA
jgi:hypothetical protein